MPTTTTTTTTTNKEKADNDDIELTTEEAKQLESAFKDADFCKLLSDYVSEISNPEFKEEQEKYIAQLEAKNELPTGKALVRPSSGFVVKCMHEKKRQEQDFNNATNKLFLNIVHSEKVDEPSASDGRSNWSLPFVIGPLRMEHDKGKKNLVPTFDCCFHPLTLRQAHGSKEFLNLVVDIANDAVVNSFTSSGDEVEMLPGYTILKGVSYKSGTRPKALMISSSSVAEKEKKNDLVVSTAVSVDKDKSSRTGDDTAVASSNDNKEDEMIIPKYKIVEQGVFDMLEQTNDKQTTQSRRPKQLIVHIHLDKATTSAADINLDVSEKELKIVPDDKCRYKLELNLPYTVNSTMGNASFDKKQSVLVVKLPVV